ncbi:unnamed protein product [Peronospora belbahrii]|nr:unnamed protein product [Peronospora belbahrii]
MRAQVQSDLPGRERLPQKVAHRNDPVLLPRSRAIKPVSAPRRKPLVKSRLAMVTTSKRVEKPRRLLGDETVFYPNIWSPPETAGDVSATKKLKQLVDISQIAHVLTTLDYKSGYEAPTNAESVNIWASLESQQNAKRAAMMNKTQQLASNVSASISEHSSEESSSLVISSSVLSLGPLRMGASTLRKELWSGEFPSVMKTPISAPRRKGVNVVFSNVLTRNDEVNMSWNSQLLLGMHEPIRHALFVIDRFLERSRDLKKSPMNRNVREFFSWFKRYFVEFVRNQHNVKTTVLLPLVVIKVVEKRDIATFYQTIFALVDVIISHEAQLLLAVSTAGSWQIRLTILQDDIRRLNYLLLNVLALEEVAFLPAIEHAFSEKAFYRYVMPRIFRATRPKRIMVPWIVERSRIWGGNKVAKAYKDDISFTARFLYDHVWHPYFENNIASTMKHLDNDVEGVAAKGSDASWLGCSIM